MVHSFDLYRKHFAYPRAAARSIPASARSKPSRVIRETSSAGPRRPGGNARRKQGEVRPSPVKAAARYRLENDKPDGTGPGGLQTASSVPTKLQTNFQTALPSKTISKSDHHPAHWNARQQASATHFPIYNSPFLRPEAAPMALTHMS